MKVGIVMDERYLSHRPEGYHPENPQRLRVIYEWLEGYQYKNLIRIPPRPATEDEVQLVHTREYLKEVQGIDGTSGHFDADTYYSMESFRIAMLAAGGVLAASDAVAERRAESAFALIRPPGHHAERDRAMGFCIFNNVAIAARDLQKKHGIERVLIVDWDLHHGNGTQWTFYSDPSVLYFSTHQYPYYPGTGSIDECGAGEGAGFNINVPLPAGMNDADYAGIFNEILLPVTEEYKPEFVLVSAGFDAHRDDPLGGMSLTEKGFKYMTELLHKIALKHSGGRMLLCLEGGYNLDALKNSVAGVLSILQGGKAENPGVPSDKVNQIIERVKKKQKEFWKKL